MNHKVNNVGELHADATNLYNKVVVGSDSTSADSLINNLVAGINNLKTNWKGRDAGVQIQNLVGVHNALVGIRNALASLAVDSSKVAVNYRDIQRANGATDLEQLGAVSADTKSMMENYSDTSDTVNINQAANEGKAKIDAANGAMDGFISQVSTYYNNIMNNWTQGTGRDNATQAFEQFISSSKTYKETLSSVSQSIATALSNYSF